MTRIECTNDEQVLLLLKEIRERADAIEKYLQRAESASNGTKNHDVGKAAASNATASFTGHKTKYGTYIDSATEQGLRGILKKPVRILCRETLFHSKCCLCQTDDISVMALTVKRKCGSFVVPLCGICKAKLEKRKESKRAQKSIYWGSVIKTAFETNRRKF